MSDDQPPRRASTDELCAELRSKVPRILIRLASAGLPGIRFQVFEAWRTERRQKWLFDSPARGGKHLTDMDGTKKIGKHQRGEAVDIAALDKHGDFAPDGHPAWALVAAAGEAEGLKSGRTWGDWPHLETKPRTNKEVQSG